MMAVIFEVQPAPGQQDAYLQAAAALRPLLEQVDGFISIERRQPPIVKPLSTNHSRAS